MQEAVLRLSENLTQVEILRLLDLCNRLSKVGLLQAGLPIFEFES
jgi:hypothetical protein